MPSERLGRQPRPGEARLSAASWPPSLVHSIEKSAIIVRSWWDERASPIFALPSGIVVLGVDHCIRRFERVVAA